MHAFINIGTAEFTLLFIVWLIPLFLIIITLIDLFKRDFTTKSTDKVVIIFLIGFLPILGSLIYLFGIKKYYPNRVGK